MFSQNVQHPWSAGVRRGSDSDRNPDSKTRGRLLWADVRADGLARQFLLYWLNGDDDSWVSPLHPTGPSRGLVGEARRYPGIKGSLKRGYGGPDYGDTRPPRRFYSTSKRASCWRSVNQREGAVGSRRQTLKTWTTKLRKLKTNRNKKHT